mmetsp:Transcript_68208/g.142540  ORF Transcript_68208/g.142540 Transcript_68208/m.142540 type:complete len:561 (+) Transcript_68208:73-1755(+)
MPYLEDGETWDTDYGQYMEGMAENRPGHKKFEDYELPRWVKHPLNHPFSGLLVDVKDYAYASVNGALDGLTNFHRWGPAHIACMYGDMEMLTSCSEAELNAQTSNGETPAYYAVRYGTSWCLQWLVENGYDSTTAANNGYTPAQLIHANNCIHTNEVEYLELALRGELVEKKSIQAQEFKLQRWKVEGLDKYAEEFLSKNKEKQRWHLYRMGDYKSPYRMPSHRENVLKADLPRSQVAMPPEKAKPPLPAAMLFPGQGSQYIGMLAEASKLPAVKELLSKAQSVLGWDVLELCTKGPEAKLSETKYCQPVLFVAGLAAVEVLRESKKEVVERPQAVAGLSLGEYTAICAAGVLDFEDCLRLVQLRAEAMQDATNLAPQGMASVAGLDRSTLERLCREAKAADSSVQDPVCQIANVLFPAGFVCAGHKSTIDKLCEKAMAARALQARAVKAGGAFHCPLMQPAADRLSKAIDEALPKMRPPRCCIYFNVTGKKVMPGTSPKEFVQYMKRQLTGEVLWEQTVKQMIMDQVKDFYETGPLKQIKAMIKRIDQDAFKRTENISV